MKPRNQSTPTRSMLRGCDGAYFNKSVSARPTRRLYRFNTCDEWRMISRTLRPDGRVSCNLCLMSRLTSGTPNLLLVSDFKAMAGAVVARWNFLACGWVGGRWVWGQTGRAVLNEGKKKCSRTQVSQKCLRAHHVLAVGSWQLAIGDWRWMAVGGG